MKNTEPINPFDNFAFYYEERPLKDEETRKKREERTKAELEALEIIFTKRGINLSESTIVDMGGGTGRIAYPLSLQAKKIILAEPPSGMLNVAKSKYDTVEHGDIEFLLEGFLDVSLFPDSIDGLISLDGPFMYLIELKDQLMALENIKRILKPNGLVLIEVHNFFSIIMNFQHPKPEIWETEKYEISRFISHETFNFRGIWQHTEHTFIEDKETNEIRNYESVHHLKNTTSTELFLLFQKVGFENIKLFPGRNPSAEEGTRFWVVTKKKKKKYETK